VLLDKVYHMLIQFPKAFKGEFSIPDGVGVIDSNTFAGCAGLTAVYIPSSVEVIDVKPFAGCASLNDIFVDPENEYYCDDEGVLFDWYTMALVDYPEGRAGEYTIPEGWTGVDAYAFQGNTGLTGVTIPSGVKTIGRNAFEGCTSMKFVNIGADVVSIGDYAFAECSSLSTLDYRGLKNPCDRVKNHTFEGCVNLRAICIPTTYDDNDYTFCGSREICFGTSIEDLGLRSSVCGEEFCFDGLRYMRLTDEMKAWNDRSNACVDFKCDDRAGKVQWSMCNKTEEENNVCWNDGCMVREQPMVVEVDMEGIQAGDFDTETFIYELEQLSGHRATDIGYELGDYAAIIRVIIVIDDAEVGQTIVDAVNNLEKGPGCQYRTICRSKYARLVVSGLELSEARTNHLDTVTFMGVFAMLVAMMTFFN